MRINPDKPQNDNVQVLLIRRKGATENGKWALPGGFVNCSNGLGEPMSNLTESPETTALRELNEETGLDISVLRQARIIKVGEYFTDNTSVNKRDPRDNNDAWTHSTAFVINVSFVLPKKRLI